MEFTYFLLLILVLELNYNFHLRSIYQSYVFIFQMAKRVADKYLTDRNWEEDPEGEEVRPYYPQLYHLVLVFAQILFNSASGTIGLLPCST